MVVGAKDAWEAMVLMHEGLERLAVHKEDQQFGIQVWVLEMCY